jgi:hypothetical protein
MKKLLLSIIMIMSATALLAQDCSDLFFSEYIEGTGNNKVLEIYNPTENPIDLSIYVIRRYSNGSPTPTEELNLSGTIQPYETVVVTNGQEDSVWVSSGSGYWSPAVWPELFALGDLHCSGDYPTPFYFNGNDAMTLETITDNVVDIFGKYGFDPGDNGWNDIPPTYLAGDQFWTSWTKDQTLVRKASVMKGVTDNPDLFQVNMEWDSLPKDTFDSLRFHNCECNVSSIGELANGNSFVIYPNPASGPDITIDASDEISRVEIFNLVGQAIVRQDAEKGVQVMEVGIPEDQEGIFMVRILFEDNTTVTQKLVLR